MTIAEPIPTWPENDAALVDGDRPSDSETEERELPEWIQGVLF